jgi:hypothetical protein
MIPLDLANRLSIQRAISPTRVTDNTAQVSQIIDMQALSSCLFALFSGTIADSDATSTVLLEEGDASNLSDAAAVADADMQSFVSGSAPEASAAMIFSEDDTVKWVGYCGTKRYIRLTWTPAANSGNWDLSVLAIGVKRFQGTGN